MSEAIFGLLGTLVGGLVTFLVAWMRSAKELELWNVKYNAELLSSDMRLRRDRYAEFTGALNKLLGDFEEVRDTLSQDCALNKQVIRNIVGHDDFAACAATLNSGKAWISLVALDQAVWPKADEIEDAFNKVVSRLWDVRDGRINLTQREEVLRGIDALRKAYFDIIPLLRNDLKTRILDSPVKKRITETPKS